jgi:hypothetical protein
MILWDLLLIGQARLPFRHRGACYAFSRGI